MAVGTFEGETALAVGVNFSGERASFQIGITSAGGSTGAGAGVNFGF